LRPKRIAVIGGAAVLAAVLVYTLHGETPSPTPDRSAASAAADQAGPAARSGSPSSSQATGTVELARAMRAVAAARAEAAAARDDHAREVASQKRDDERLSAVPAEPARAPATQPITAEETSRRDEVDSPLVSAEGRPQMPRPDREVLQALLQEIANTDDPGLRRGLTGSYRDMVEGLAPDEVVVAIDLLDKARANKPRAR
jgi:hypothetical protein